MGTHSSCRGIYRVINWLTSILEAILQLNILYFDFWNLHPAVVSRKPGWYSNLRERSIKMRSHYSFNNKYLITQVAAHTNLKEIIPNDDSFQFERFSIFH